jgi:hypothetical protein
MNAPAFLDVLEEINTMVEPTPTDVDGRSDLIVRAVCGVPLFG